MDTRPIAALRPHPRNAAIYGDQADSELVESIRAKDVLTPLLITRAGIVISGHRRLDAARKAGLTAVPVTLYGSEDELDILGALLESNKQRAKTNEQIGREYAVSLEVEAAEARKRLTEAAERTNASRAQDERTPVLNSTQASAEQNGKARDKAAERIGVGWQKAERAAAVVQAADRLAEEGKTREAAQLRTALNGKSVSRAYAEAQERGYVASPPPPAPPNYGRVITLEEWSSLSAEQQDRALGLRDPKFKLNSQGTDNIEWALHSWNPVTGCKHDCSYCYARDIAVRRYPHGFVPAILPGRLAGPRNTPVPPEAATSIAHRNVFTCSMADLFGKWVPREWIEAVLHAVADNPQWNFLFLTKFPTRLAEFEFPANAWLGTSVDAQARIPNAEKAFARVQGGVKWLSCEPMLERLTFTRLDLFDWVVVGGASRSTQTPEFRPPREWVTHLERQAEAAGCKVYEKTNLLERRREYPGAPALEPVVVPDAFKMGYLQRDVLPLQAVGAS